MRHFLFSIGLTTLLGQPVFLQGQSTPSTHAMGLYCEPPVPGWIPGQSEWPGLQPLESGDFGFCAGLKQHPHLPGQAILTLGGGYQRNRDWLTIRLIRHGWWEFGFYQTCLGLSRGFQKHSAGMTLAAGWFPREKNQTVEFGLGTEHRISETWRCGFRIKHAFSVPKGFTTSGPSWQSGMHLAWEQKSLKGALRLYAQPRNLPVTEWILGYHPGNRWSFWLVSDPWAGLVGIGMGLLVNKHRWTVSTIQSNLPSPYLRSTYHHR